MNKTHSEERPCLLPIPQLMIRNPGYFTSQISLGPAESEGDPIPKGSFIPSGIKAPLLSIWPEFFGKEKTVFLEIEEGFPREGYQLSVEETGISIRGSEPAGIFYGCMTLRQLFLKYPEGIPCCEITDKPDLQLRGVMMDISRSKIPTLKTLKEQADLLASLKINHLELYMEGLAFAYPSFRQFFGPEQTPLTPEELKEFEGYCKERFIELVPCQNCLGHMGAWLAFEEWKHLAECPEGFSAMGHQIPPTTMDPTDPGALLFAKTLLEDVIPYFTSGYFNACLDEPFELGKGKNKENAEAAGIDEIYLEYVREINKILKDHGKTMMMWGDVISKSERMMRELPEDIVVMEWGYEQEYPMRERARDLQAAGLKYCLCPGTNSWSSFTGTTDNMLASIRQSAQAAKEFGGEGMMVTDWGDMGHLQYTPFSWPAYAYAAACAWGDIPEEEGLGEALSRFVFEDMANETGRFLLEAGRYYLLEEFRLPCRTLTHQVLSSPSLKREEYEKFLQFMLYLNRMLMREEVNRSYIRSYEEKEAPDFGGQRAYINQLKIRLDRCAPKDTLVKEECQNALSMIDFCIRLRSIIYGEDTGEGMEEALNILLKEHSRLWMLRNQPGGLEQGYHLLAKWSGLF